MIGNLNKIITCTLLLAVFLGLSITGVLANGDETLGAPIGLDIATGSGIVANGTGLAQSQPGTIYIDIPVGATIKQVLLYWEGQHSSGLEDNNITVKKGLTEVTVDGVLIGGPDLFLDNINPFSYSSTYRANITSLGFIEPGPNSIEVSGLDFQYPGIWGINNGAGILVIYDDLTNTSDIQLRDGNDIAFINWVGDRHTTVEQEFIFSPAAVDRTASLTMFFSSVKGIISSGGFRPNAINITVGSGTPYTVNNELYSNNGEEWDTLLIDVNIPAGTGSLKVQALSIDNLGLGRLPASFIWNAAALSLPIPPAPPQDNCSLTLGYWKTHANPLEKKYDETWDLVGPNSLFIDSTDSTTRTWLDMLSLPTEDRPYVILARQWIAVYLNKLNGANINDVQTEFDTAETLLRANAGDWQNPDIDIGSLSSTLDDYNNGITGPGHCSD